jgi:hypothetical protein
MISVEELIYEFKLTIISNIDQEEILKYFSGQIDHTEDIDTEF